MKLIKNIIIKKFSLFVIYLFLISSIYTTFNIGRYTGNSVLVWDIFNYHLYLPETFIYQDFRKLEFLDSAIVKYNPSPTCPRFGIYLDFNTYNYFNKFPCGVALFEMPGFLIAHTFAKITNLYPADGFSPPYQLSVVLSTILFGFFSLLLLRSFLKRYFNELEIGISFLIIVFGTNFYHYNSLEAGLSHIYLFFCFSALIHQTEVWHRLKTRKSILLIGLILGLAVLTRPSNALMVIIPLLWNINNLKEKLKLIRTSWLWILIAFLVFIIVLSPQLLYWKYVTGQYLYYSYGVEKFNFSEPQILKGLFSFRKGWFVYSPLVMIGFIGLIYSFFNKKYSFFSWMALIFFIIDIWVVFSWWNWYYGGSFGCRAMLETLALLAFPLTLIVSKVIDQKRKILKYVFFTIVALGIGLNLFQTWQYKRCIIHWDKMNQEYYWKVFLKKSVSTEDSKLLEKTKEID